LPPTSQPFSALPHVVFKKRNKRNKRNKRYKRYKRN
jgi:hypothetical protein